MGMRKGPSRFFESSVAQECVLLPQARRCALSSGNTMTSVKRFEPDNTANSMKSCELAQNLSKVLFQLGSLLISRSNKRLLKDSHERLELLHLRWS